MKGVILYYSFGGSTARLAKELSEKTGFTLYGVKEKKKRNMIGAFLKGCRQAMKRQPVELEPVEIDWTGIQKVIVACPIWAGYPAPAFNSIIKLVPKKLPTALYFVSGSGSSQNSRHGTEAILAEAGHNILSYNDVMTKSLYPQRGPASND